MLASKFTQENKGLGYPSVQDSKGECPANNTLGTLKDTHILRPLDVLKLACNTRSRCSLRHRRWQATTLCTSAQGYNWEAHGREPCSGYGRGARRVEICFKAWLFRDG